MNSPVTAVAAMMKNEGPYVLEWVAWHRMIGIDRIFVADNGGNDGMSELLAALDAAGAVTRLSYPKEPEPKVSIQSKCYERMLELFGAEADWMAFIDADEFLYPRPPLDGIKGFIDRIPEDVGAIGINWKTYGSSGRTDPGFGEVVTRFAHRAERDEPVNAHYKTLVRTAAAQPRVRNPHHIDIAGGYRRVNVNFQDQKLNENGIGLSQSVHWGELWINHYVVKSEAEFWNKKVTRGRPKVEARPRDQAFFRGHSSFTAYDPLPRRVHLRLLEEMESLLDALSTSPAHLRNLNLSIRDISMPEPE